MSRFGQKEVMDVVFYDLTTNVPIIRFDSLKTSSLENSSQETVIKAGRGAAEILRFDYGREANFKFSDALLSPSSLSLFTGSTSAGTSTLSTGVVTLYEREVFTLTASLKVYLKHIPLANTIFVYKITDNQHDGAKCTITTSGIEVTVSSGAVSTNQIAVYYQYTSVPTAQTLILKSDAFPSYYKIVGDTLVKNEISGVTEGFQMVINKAKIKGALKLDFKSDSGDAMVQDFECQVFKPSTSTEMIKMIKY